MDPITIIGTIGATANIVDVVSKSIKSISELRERWKDADITLLGLASQLTALRAALSKINEWTSYELESGPHHQLIMDLDVSIKCCELLMSKINLLLGELGNTVDEPLDFASAVKLVFKGKSIESVQKMIQQQTSALNLLLTACNCKTLAEQKELLEKSKTRKLLGSAQHNSASLYVQRDSVSIISRFSDNLSKISMIFSFDSEIFSSKIYQNMLRGSVKEALRRKQIEMLQLERSNTGKGRSNAVDQGIKGDSSEEEIFFKPFLTMEKRAVKLVMLRIGDSGEDNIINQIKKVYGSQESAEELYFYRFSINKNIIEGVQKLIEVVGNGDVTHSKINKEYYELLSNYTFRGHMGNTLEPYIGEAIASLWHDPYVITIIREYSGEDFRYPTPYFFDEIKRIASPDYVPSKDDILKVDSAGLQNGIKEINFKARRRHFQLFDVPSQEMKVQRCMHFFECVFALVFVVDISSYDHVSQSILETNALEAAIQLFRFVVNSPCFARSRVILILNNITRFREKIIRSPLVNYFPDYQEDTSHKYAVAYILQLFEEANEANIPMHKHCLDPGVDALANRLVDSVEGMKNTYLSHLSSNS